MARSYSEEAITRLLYWLRSDHPRASVGAASILLDRGYGKAPQQIALDATLRDCRMDGKPMTPDEWDSVYGSAPKPN